MAQKGGCGQFITHCLCRSFLLKGGSSHSSPDSAFPFNGRQTSTNFSNLPCSAVLDKLLEDGSFFPWGLLGTDCFSNGSQTLPANLQPGSSPWSHRSYQKCQLLMGPHEQQAWAVGQAASAELISLCSVNAPSSLHPWVHALCPGWAQQSKAGLCCCWRQSQHITLVRK